MNGEREREGERVQSLKLATSVLLLKLNFLNPIQIIVWYGSCLVPVKF